MSTDGGSRARWSPSGRHIYYWSGEEIYEIPIEVAPAVRLGTPRVLFDLGNLKMQSWGRYNALPTSDPNRFLMLTAAEKTSESLTDVIVVQNWPVEFRRK